jgi:arabinofuranan 3-O-arabinosyltransferase
LLTLADEGLLGSRPVLLDSDSAGLPAASSVVTDSLRRRVRNFGELQRSYSPTLTAAQPARTYEAVGDYTEPGWSRYLSAAQYRGIRDVTASSSAADIGAIPAQWASGLLPYAAVDGDPRTMWESGGWAGPAGQWIRLRFVSPVGPGSIRVAFADRPSAGPPVTQVAVRTAAGRVTDRVRVTGRPQVLRVPPGATGWLQLTVTGLASPAWVPCSGGHQGDHGARGTGQPADRGPRRTPGRGHRDTGQGPAVAVRVHAHLAAVGVQPRADQPGR